MALDKKSDDTLFGVRTYMFLDQEITEKEIGREKTSFGTIWASPHILDVSGISTGRIQYERGYKTNVPLRPS